MAIRDERGSKLIPCAKAAELYGCTMSYIRRLARAGKLDTELQAGSYFFHEAQVKRLAAKAATATGRHRKRSSKFGPG